MRQRGHATALAQALALAMSAAGCLFGPMVTCHSVSAEDCDRAVEMARPLVAAYMDQANEILVHPGVCTRDMQCSARQANFPGFITVELLSEQPEAASVVIDMTGAEWTASCRLIVSDEDGNAHGEPCAAP